jgi:hypothetical protein
MSTLSALSTTFPQLSTAVEREGGLNIRKQDQKGVLHYRIHCYQKLLKKPTNSTLLCLEDKGRAKQSNLYFNIPPPCRWQGKRVTDGIENSRNASPGGPSLWCKTWVNNENGVIDRGYVKKKKTVCFSLCYVVCYKIIKSSTRLLGSLIPKKGGG